MLLALIPSSTTSVAVVNVETCTFIRHLNLHPIPYFHHANPSSNMVAYDDENHQLVLLTVSQHTNHPYTMKILTSNLPSKPLRVYVDEQDAFYLIPQHPGPPTYHDGTTISSPPLPATTPNAYVEFLVPLASQNNITTTMLYAMSDFSLVHCPTNRVIHQFTSPIVALFTAMSSSSLVHAVSRDGAVIVFDPIIDSITCRFSIVPQVVTAKAYKDGFVFSTLRGHVYWKQSSTSEDPEQRIYTAGSVSSMIIHGETILLLPHASVITHFSTWSPTTSVATKSPTKHDLDAMVSILSSHEKHHEKLVVAHTKANMRLIAAKNTLTFVRQRQQQQQQQDDAIVAITRSCAGGVICTIKVSNTVLQMFPTCQIALDIAACDENNNQQEQRHSVLIAPLCRGIAEFTINNIGLVPINLTPYVITRDETVTTLLSKPYVVDVLDAMAVDSDCWMDDKTMEPQDITFMLRLQGRKQWFEAHHHNVTATAAGLLRFILLRHDGTHGENMNHRWRVVEPHTGRVVFYLLRHDDEPTKIRVAAEFDVDDEVEIKITGPSLYVVAAMRESIARRCGGGMVIVPSRPHILITKRVMKARDAISGFTRAATTTTTTTNSHAATTQELVLEAYISARMMS